MLAFVPGGTFGNEGSINGENKMKDYEAVCDFLIELNRENQYHINWNWARFEWMTEHPEFDKGLINSIGLWMDGGRVVGAAIYDMYFGKAFVGALPAYSALYPEILDSDLLIWSYPLYCYGMPAPLKSLLDRTLPLSSMAMHKVGDRYEHVGQRDFTHLHYVMICGCGFPNSKQNFEPAVAQFKLCFPNNHTILTVPESPMFNAPEAQTVTMPRLEKIKEAGKQFAERLAISDGLMQEITSPMIPEEQYAAIVNGSVR
ncbi:MAG TPA: hypothetical protein DCY72_02915 [Ruminococcaceae bacterium]|nr:hypothetical protein [Oscillospiraceae bacterium]